MIYLDYAATSPVRSEVVEIINNSLSFDFGNPSSIYRIGKSNKVKLIQARQSMAKHLNIKPSQLFYTSGATEANNWAIMHQAYRSKELGLGHHIVSTSIEHPSVKKVLEHLESDGFEVTYLNPNADFELTTAMFLEASQSQTIGWVAMAVNNEVGSILPINEIGQVAQAKGLWFHVDTVQAIGHIDISEMTPYTTSFVGSAHKFGGPKGIGFMVYQPWNDQMFLKPFVYGGGQENQLRSGTENVAYILGMAEALNLAFQELQDQYHQSKFFRKIIIESLNIHEIAYEINGDPKQHVPHVLNVWFPDYDASQLLIKLDLNDIYVSAGSACSAGSVKDSDILKAYYPTDSDRWHQSIRISMGYQTTETDINLFIQSLIQIMKGK